MSADSPVYLDGRFVAKRYSLTLHQLRKMINQGYFPKPLRIGYLERWLLADLQAWEAGGFQPMQPRLRLLVGGRIQKKILVCLDKNRTGYSGVEVAEQIKEKVECVRVALNRLRRLGLVCNENNVWRSTAHPVESAGPSPSTSTEETA